MLYAKHLNKEIYAMEELDGITTEDENLNNHISFLKQMFVFGFESIGDVKEDLNNDLLYYTERLNYNLSTSFKGRTTGDDPNDFTQVSYGNNKVKPIKESEEHGTHVAGIIAAKRNNGLGVDGVANNVEIMVLRAVPNGDEYDKDVYLAIKYAVDNGAQIINTSFGKYYSPHSDKVREAIAYAAKNDVLIINAAGNESLDIDENEVYPNDAEGLGQEISDTFITVGALVPDYGSQMVANYSNYGKVNVDIFAPGSKIYSTFPENEYKSINGTSMASPGVAGVAALIRSYYPKLSAAQVKEVILESGLAVKSKVIVGGNFDEGKSFEEICTSGKIANAYNALIFASRKVQKKPL
jgi:subtilisin family serine protease